jgi:hypothetical protein
VGPAVVGFGRGWGRGSGVVTSPGRILTNAHNLRGTDVTVNFADGRREQGTVAGSDPDFDLAVVRVDTGEIEPVEWDPAAVAAEIGAPVVALARDERVTQSASWNGEACVTRARVHRRFLARPHAAPHFFDPETSDPRRFSIREVEIFLRRS